MAQVAPILTIHTPVTNSEIQKSHRFVDFLKISLIFFQFQRLFGFDGGIIRMEED